MNGLQERIKFVNRGPTVYDIWRQRVKHNKQVSQHRIAVTVRRYTAVVQPADCPWAVATRNDKMYRRLAETRVWEK
jgi:hypothetical protein